MTQAKTGDTVKVHYTGKLEDGTPFDSSLDKDPLEFTLGEGRIIPGFEQAVLGMNPGDSKTVDIPANSAYGPYRDDWVMVVEREQIPAEINPQVGQQLQVRQGEQEYVVQITDVSGSEVTLDRNHPLAGEDLTFDIELMEIV